MYPQIPAVHSEGPTLCVYTEDLVWNLIWYCVMFPLGPGHASPGSNGSWKEVNNFSLSSPVFRSPLVKELQCHIQQSIYTLARKCKVDYKLLMWLTDTEFQVQSMCKSLPVDLYNRVMLQLLETSGTVRAHECCVRWELSKWNNCIVESKNQWSLWCLIADSTCSCLWVGTTKIVGACMSWYIPLLSQLSLFSGLDYWNTLLDSWKLPLNEE